MQDIKSIFRHNESLSFTRYHDGNVYFLLQKPDENNAQVLMRRTAAGQLQRLTPPGTSVRSRLHEYGAMPYCVARHAVYFCRHDSQQIVHQPIDGDGIAGPATALTPEPAIAAGLRYADFVIDHSSKRLIAVREDHRQAGEARNTLVSMGCEPDARSGVNDSGVNDSGVNENGVEAEVLFDGSDFVINPRLSPDGRQLAFITWDHPNMPWDHTRLWLATLDTAGAISSLRELQQPRPGAIQQLQFSNEGDLYFLADWTDWWNLYRIDHAQLNNGGAELHAPTEPLYALSGDCAGPPWVPGLQHYAIMSRQRLALASLHQAHWSVSIIDVASRQSQVLWRGIGAVDALCAGGGEDLIASLQPVDRPPLLLRRTLTQKLDDYRRHSDVDSLAVEASTFTHDDILLQCRSDAWQSAHQVHTPLHLSFPVPGQDDLAHGLLYLPADTTRPPPLLVMVHGGPTGTARSAFNPLTQFWVNQGFAVLDVNHRGSSGYGRRYRQLLLGQWGIIDIEDVITAIEHLFTLGQVDPTRVVIRGGSAGGYAVLAALAHSDLLRAGTCCYGISDMTSLASETHKFESRYVERLIGSLPEAAPAYHARSPINHLDRIKAPVLWLHGALDQVVPPNQATAIMETLQRRNAQSRYLCFDDEGHGFRLPANQIRALREELGFYRSVGALHGTNPV